MNNQNDKLQELLEWVEDKTNHGTDTTYCPAVKRFPLMQKIKSLISDPTADTDVATEPREWQVGDLIHYNTTPYVLECARIISLNSIYFNIKFLDEPEGREHKVSIRNEKIRNIDAERRALQAEIAELKENIKNQSDGYHTMDELYMHRYKLFATLVNQFYDRAWKSKLHADGTMFDDYFIAGISTVQGQATYHMPLTLWDIFQCQEIERAPKWDGHTSEDVLERLLTL